MTKKKKSILLVEDNAGHARLISREFQADENDYRVVVATNLSEARNHLNEFQPDLIIADLLLPDGKGTELLERESVEPRLPLIILTGFGDEQVAVDALTAGALDYVVKLDSSINDIIHIAERAMSRWDDIVERRRAEKALAESEEKFRALIENAGLFITIIDEKGQYLYLSPAVESMTGFAVTTMVGKSIADYLHPEDKAAVMNIIELAGDQSGNPVPIHHFRMRRIEGDWVSLEGMITDMSNVPGINGTVICARDVTELKKMEERLNRKQKLESIGLLAGGIAHDFNNVLTVILGHLSVAKISDDSDKRAANLSEAEEGVFKARDLTQQLITFAAGGEPVKESASIKDIIDEVTQFSLSGSNVSFDLNFAEELLAVNIDKGQIKQAINNLIINADQAMPAGGVIVINAFNTQLDNQNIYGLAPGQYIRIEIIDKGIGISEKYRGKIFDPYFTTKNAGSGLGLAIVYSIITSHNGFVDLKSQPGKGTTFFILLPALKTLATDHNVGESLLKGEGKILVMDNEKSIRDVAHLLLERLGYETAVVKNGEEVLEIYRREHFDAIILDLTIPGAMGGLETAQKIRKIDKDIVLIVSSGYSNSPVMANYRDFGFNAVLTKPYRLVDVAQLMFSLLQHPDNVVGNSLSAGKSHE